MISNEKLSRNKNWYSSYTYPKRYADIGVITRIGQYLLKEDTLEEVSVLDVGCSTGIASKHMKDFFMSNYVKMHVTGIDTRQIVKKMAESNLDCFILGDILTTKIQKKFDVIICTRMLLNMSIERKEEALRKIATMMKPNGCFVTDVYNYKTTTWKQFFSGMLYDLIKIIKKSRYGIRTWIDDIKRRELESLQSRIKILIGPEQVNQFISQMTHNWNDLNMIDKKIVIFGEYVGRILCYTNTKPSNKNPPSLLKG